MSLVVSLRIPDGVVIAADSLTTLQGQIAFMPQIEISCPKCSQKIKSENSPPLMMPTALSTSTYGQKLFCFGENYGIGAFGQSILLGKSVGYLIERLEHETNLTDLEGVSDLGHILRDRFDKLIHEQIKDIDRAPDDFYPLGFQVAGYDSDEGKTIEVKIGKNSQIVPIIGMGCTFSGAGQVVLKLWELARQEKMQPTNYAAFSLQDAIDYADFLINTTASYQRFALMIPNVGGEVDIALVTPYRKFTWIRRKKLSRIIMGEGASNSA